MSPARRSTAALARADLVSQALIVEAQALFAYSIDALFRVKCDLHPHVSSVLRAWASSHGAWRALVLVDEAALYPMSIELIADPELQITV